MKRIKGGGSLRSDVVFIDTALQRALPPEGRRPSEIHRAMRYAVLGEGKRFRPRLVLAACRAVGGDPRKALPAACAVEMIHAYSLVHDDLPSLDNDDLRRGKPTVHKKFGEALAILAGDALLTRAFQILSDFKPAQKSVLLLRELAAASGTAGMIGGQVVDILWARNEKPAAMDLATADFISRCKTGALIQAGAVLGALVGTSAAAKISRIREIGGLLGLAFQVVDDIMDRDGYLRFMNPDQAQQKAVRLLEKARRLIQTFNPYDQPLEDLTDLLLKPLISR